LGGAAAIRRHVSAAVAAAAGRAGSSTASPAPAISRAQSARRAARRGGRRDGDDRSRIAIVMDMHGLHNLSRRSANRSIAVNVWKVIGAEPARPLSAPRFACHHRGLVDRRAAMRWRVFIGAILAAATAVGIAVGRAAPNAALPVAAARDDAKQVDVELILAVDVSYSMDVEELAIQREGYAQALMSSEFLKTLKTGPHGRIAVTYFEWAASGDQKIILPWQIIDGPESADAVAAEILKAPIRRASRTSISGAINFALPLFEQNPYHGLRRVIDISGDGPNNNGEPVTIARDAAIAKGIVINGLPIMVKEPSFSMMDIENLDYYYEDCVIGGPGAFVVTIKDRDKFKEAIHTKLVMEVAGRTPSPRLVPVADDDRPARVSCLVGEKIWQDRWGR